MKRIFVTGGAGYIGSHMVAALCEKGFNVLIYDNLSTGHRDAVHGGKLVIGDLKDQSLLNQSVSSNPTRSCISQRLFRWESLSGNR